MGLHAKIPRVRERSLLLGRPNENYSYKIGIVNTLKSDNIWLMSRYLEIGKFGELQGGITVTECHEPIVKLYKRRKGAVHGSMTGPYYMTPKTYSEVCTKMLVEQKGEPLSMVKYPVRSDVPEPGRTIEFRRSK